MTIDPLAEDYDYQSVYAFAANNPSYFVDINGMGVLDDFELNKKTGEINLVKTTEDKTDKLIDSETKEVVSENVAKGLLSDGLNIKNDGLETSNTRGGAILHRLDVFSNYAGNLIFGMCIETTKDVTNMRPSIRKGF